MNVTDLIIRKRDGGELRRQEISDLVRDYTVGDVPDYQMSAFLMAAFLRGMSDDEMMALTESMLHSGSVLDLSDIPGTKVDKHSTGGVGDKVSILLAPIVAACGVPVPMISGRGLGHTGGTLDKLESIPGFDTDLTIDEYRRQLADLGVVMIGQTAEIAPADRKMYALRDVTGTVEFIPFIAASILSKKLAEGIDALVLDVKVGSGAFMKEEARARELAETMVRISEQFDKRTVALLTDMDQPLGRAVGNWPEVVESIRSLNGEGPDDLMEVTVALAAEMLRLGGVSEDDEDARLRVEEAISGGSALRKLAELIDRQGGDVSVLDDPAAVDAGRSREIRAADGDGPYVARIDALTAGRAALAAGAGRRTKEDDVDPKAGFVLDVTAGDGIRSGDRLATLYASTERGFDEAESLLREAFEFGDAPDARGSVIRDRYTVSGWMNP